MTKRKYSGKYPTRVRSVASIKGDKGTVLLQLNNGEKFTVQAADVGGVMPNLGQEIVEFPSATKFGA